MILAKHLLLIVHKMQNKGIGISGTSQISFFACLWVVPMQKYPSWVQVHRTGGQEWIVRIFNGTANGAQKLKPEYKVSLRWVHIQTLGRSK